MTFDDFKFECQRRATNFANWCNDNKEWLIPLIPAVITGVATVADVTAKSTRYRDEKRLKDRMVYDRRLGAYLETKRTLTNTEKVELARRHDNGESIATILASMGVLK